MIRKSSTQNLALSNIFYFMKQSLVNHFLLHAYSIHPYTHTCSENEPIVFVSLVLKPIFFYLQSNQVIPCQPDTENVTIKINKGIF